MVKRTAIAALIATLVGGIGAQTALAESALWTLVASPLTATTGTPTTFTLTATNLDALEPLDSSREIGCVVVDVPANFTVQSAAVSGASGGRSWSSSVTGNRVRVLASSGGDRLGLNQWVRFTVRATPTAAGQLAWDSRAYRDTGCGGTGALLGVPPIVVVADPAATPTIPTPTLVPTPLPSVVPTPIASLIPSLRPSVGPTATPAPSPTPGEDPTGTVRPTPRPSGSDPRPSDPGPGASSDAPSASFEPGRGQSGGGGGADPLGRPSSPAGSRLGAEPLAEDAGGPGSAPLPLALGAMGLLGSIDIWIVPGLLLGVPGLLVVGFVLLQAVGALAWIPAIRRLRGPDEVVATG